MVFYCATAALRRAEMNGGVLRYGGVTASKDERRVLGFGEKRRSAFFRRMKEEERILKL